ncbi:MerR family transcriptional regulator [Paenibacillus sp. N1-5-1-14]|uniref:MerR family transcriptional regulator n=1 Tax=Paenibacillus radicibacter TaxID=2972488 RepID=UPI0021591AE5|nr:MerR family transcriptional regulator [Paenibacillus radicibacter]MCR8643660.1 MerR family transcriptional regulator [Paenibacillus radicibacter]
MKSEITISELAKLMHVSVHQIRYFEEKGILDPAYIDHNQYRMYGMDQIYQLSHILLLRKLGVPVQAIKECLTSYTAEQYQELFRTSLHEIELELQRLSQLKQFINKVVHEQQNFHTQTSPYPINQRSLTYLTHWMDLDASSLISAKQVAQHTEQLPNLFELDVHYLIKASGKSSMYLESTLPTDYSLPEGNYLTMQCLLHHDDELDPIIEQFYKYAASQAYDVIGPLLIIEKSYLSLFAGDKLHYELQILINPLPTSKGE